MVLAREGALSPTGLEGILSKEKIEKIKRSEKSSHRFVTTRVDDPGLVPDLEAAHVRFTGHVENTWLAMLLSWVLPAVIFLGLWMFLLKRMNPQSGLMSIGKSRAKVYVAHQTGVSFKERDEDEPDGAVSESAECTARPH